MRGAIAAGHPLTAEAGARVLADGGSAVDACIAAAIVSWVAESPVTGPGGGGFMLVHRARDRTSRLIDFFVTIPGVGLRQPSAGEMEEVDVGFVESSQIFRIGAASCAVPGSPAGLEYVHRVYGTRPWQSLVEPAIELARNGVELTKPQAHLHAVVDLILRHSEEGQAIFGPEGRRIVAGERLVQRDLAHTLELLSEHGSRAIYGGEVARAIASHVRERGGSITLRDLEEYRVIRRRPGPRGFSRARVRVEPAPVDRRLVGNVKNFPMLRTGGGQSNRASTACIETPRDVAKGGFRLGVRDISRVVSIQAVDDWKDDSTVRRQSGASGKFLTFPTSRRSRLEPGRALERPRARVRLPFKRHGGAASLDFPAILGEWTLRTQTHGTAGARCESLAEKAPITAAELSQRAVELVKRVHRPARR